MADRPSEDFVKSRSERNRAAWRRDDRQVAKPARKPASAPLRMASRRKRRVSTPPVPTEHQDQVAVGAWFEVWAPTKRLDPRLLYAIPNAGAGSQRGQSGKLKAEGLRAGWPDLGLALPSVSVGIRAGELIFAGLFIELKRAGWRPPKSGKALEHWRNQQNIHEMLRRNNYNVVVAIGFDEAVRAIKEYVERALRR